MDIQRKKKFLRDELFSLTLMAIVQRGKIYRAITSEGKRKEFRKQLQRKLEKMAITYSKKQTEEKHEKNIERLAQALSWSHRSVLQKGRFRIGGAQKALNLFLKYLWCLDEIPEP